jgi:opacity protein-like surface antigen
MQGVWDMKKIGLFAFFTVVCFLMPLMSEAQIYPDWVFQDVPSAYTLRRGFLELTGKYLLVNDTVDIFDIREEEIDQRALFAATIGDYSGFQGIVNYGLFDRLMLHYSYQNADMDTTLGTSSTFRNLESTTSLNTRSHDIRVRLSLFSEGPTLPALALEGGYRMNSSDDAAISFTGVRSGATTVDFLERQNIQGSDMEDRGFEVKLLASKTFGIVTPTVWLGFERYTADTRISTSIPIASIRDNFDRTIETDEDVYSAGLGLGIRLWRRMPVFLSYRYLTVNKDVETDQPINTSFLARFSNPGQDDEDTNHVFTGNLLFWVTPRINLNLSGVVYTNHFLGIVPHFDNPFTNRFLENMYGYLGVGVGVVF